MRDAYIIIHIHNGQNTLLGQEKERDKVEKAEGKVCNWPS